jgi:hypothetical protein
VELDLEPLHVGLARQLQLVPEAARPRDRDHVVDGRQLQLVEIGDRDGEVTTNVLLMCEGAALARRRGLPRSR